MISCDIQGSNRNVMTHEEYLGAVAKSIVKEWASLPEGYSLKLKQILTKYKKKQKCVHDVLSIFEILGLIDRNKKVSKNSDNNDIEIIWNSYTKMSAAVDKLLARCQKRLQEGSDGSGKNKYTTTAMTVTTTTTTPTPTSNNNSNNNNECETNAHEIINNNGQERQSVVVMPNRIQTIRQLCEIPLRLLLLKGSPSLTISEDEIFREAISLSRASESLNGKEEDNYSKKNDDNNASNTNSIPSSGSDNAFVISRLAMQELSNDAVLLRERTIQRMKEIITVFKGIGLLEDALTQSQDSGGKENRVKAYVWKGAKGVQHMITCFAMQANFHIHPMPSAAPQIPYFPLLQLQGSLTSKRTSDNNNNNNSNNSNNNEEEMNAHITAATTIPTQLNSTTVPNTVSNGEGRKRTAAQMYGGVGMEGGGTTSTSTLMVQNSVPLQNLQIMQMLLHNAAMHHLWGGTLQ